MTAVIGRAAITPVLQDPNPRATAASQLVMGEVAQVTEQSGTWRHVVMTEGGTAGWIHAGYVMETTEGKAASWQSRAAWCSGAQVQIGTARHWLPLRARVALADGDVELPGGETGRILRGDVRPIARVRQESCLSPPEEWASVHFAGAPYLWGGVTPGGVDCSGLVQTTWLARGVQLPRDAAQQATVGTAVTRERMRAGDLLFFTDGTEAGISHVAFVGLDATLIHASLAAGGLTCESWLPGQPAASLMERLVTIRRISESEPVLAP